MPEGKKKRQAALTEASGHIAALATIDRYGVPPLSVYQAFNAVGADLHGQCAMAQGAKGYSVNLSVGFDFAKLFCPGAPATLAANAGVGGLRLPTAAVVLYRLPSALTAKGIKRLPIGLAHMEGVTWEGTGTLGAKAGIGFDLIAGLFKNELSASGSIDVGVTSTKLQAAKTLHFSDAARTDLVDAVDGMLGVEIKKACIAILDANRRTLLNQAKEAYEVLKEVGTTGMTLADLAAQGEIKKSVDAVKKKATDTATGIAEGAKDATLEGLKKGEGWAYAVAGVTAAGAAGAAIAGGVAAKKGLLGKIADKIQAFLEESDEDVLSQLNTLKQILDERVRRLADRTNLDKAEAAELLEAKEASARITGFRDALFREDFSADQIFHNRMQAQTGAAIEVDDAHLEGPGGSAVTVTSYTYGIVGNLDAESSLKIVYEAKGHADAGLKGRVVSSRFRMQGANKVALIQDLHANFFQMSASMSGKLGFLRTGVSSLDTASEAEMVKEKKKSGQSAGFRRFGALTYRAATAYVDTDTGTVIPYLSGISQGVSIRTARLCSYADTVRDMKPGAKGTKDIQAFETWVTLHLGLAPNQLRTFIAEAPLGTEFLPRDDQGHGHKLGYPMDALLLEAAYNTANPSKIGRLARPLEDDVDLFSVHSWPGRTMFQQDVASGKQTISALRLRYRIQSPNQRKSKFGFPLGIGSLSKDETSLLNPISLNLRFEQQVEVGHESIVDLYAAFPGPLETRDDDDKDIYSGHERYEASIPGVILFNRA